MPEYEPGATIVGVIQLKRKNEKTGLGLEVRHGRIYVSRLTGAFAANPINPIRPGDQLLEVEGTSVDEFRGVKEIRRSIETSFTANKRLNIVVQRPDPDDTSDSTDSDYVPETDSDEENGIQIGETYQLRSLARRKELNGSIVEVMGQDPRVPDRWIIKILEVRNFRDSPAIGESISVLTEKLFKMIKPGITMKLKDLKGEDAKYNYCHCTVAECVSKERAKWLVENIIEKRGKAEPKMHDVTLEVYGRNLAHVE
eukprot:scaffold431_cov103-Cylindrotheca_fusiformis.AAC.7